MNLALLGLLALSLPAAEEAPNRVVSPAIRYDFRVITIDGLDWRRDHFARLQPVATQGGASVWTTGRDVAEALADRDPNALKTPAVAAPSRAAATVFNRATRQVASGVDRMADGPFDHATKVAYTPHYEPIREGFMVTVSGRKLDQGVLTYVVLEETRVAAVHQVTLTESVAAKACCEKECAEGCDRVASRIEVPELAHVAVAGEWLIPTDGALVVSLGVQTKADEDGKAVTVERLMLIEAAGVPDPTVKQVGLAGVSSTMSVVSNWHLDEAKEAVKLPGNAHTGAPVGPGIPLPMPMPAMPSRSLPQALAADGSPVELPPLPESSSVPTALPGSAEPCASPQAPNRKTPDSTPVDVESTRAGFTGDVLSAGACPVELKTPADEPAFRFPWRAGTMNLDVEIRLVPRSPVGGPAPKP
jgi:hypothetical protein